MIIYFIQEHGICQFNIDNLKMNKQKLINKFIFWSQIQVVKEKEFY